MDHKYIAELDLVERYLMGRLAAEETAEFEAHFVDCLECVGHLKTTKALIEGLRIVGSEQIPEPRGSEPKGLFWWARPAISRWALAAGALLLVALAGVLVVANQNWRLRGEADQARSASAEWERRFDGEREVSSLAESKRQDSERDLKTQLAQLRADLENEQKQNTEKKVDHYDSLKPQINLRVFVFGSPRRGEPATAFNEVTIPRAPANFVISVPLEWEGGYKSYVLTIRDDHRRSIWKEGGSKRDDHNSLTVNFPSTFFRAGDYLLIVEGVAEDGSTTTVGEYSFRVVKTP